MNYLRSEPCTTAVSESDGTCKFKSKIVDEIIARLNTKENSMAKYAAFNEADWITDIHAESETEALKSAQAKDPLITRVELVSENDRTE